MNRRKCDCIVIGLLWVGSAAISVGLWAGIARLGQAGYRVACGMVGHIGASNGILARLWGDCVWAWSAGNENAWLGPLRWGIAASIVMTLGFIGVGIWEHIQRRKAGDE